MKLLKTLIVAGGALAIVGLTASAAPAFFTATATANGAVHVGGLDAPTAVTAAQAPIVDTVHVNWTAPTAPAGSAIDGYYVERLSGSTAGPACGSSAGNLLAAAQTGCDDTAVPPGSYTYQVTAVLRTFTAKSTPSDVLTV